jgi:cell division protein FtsI (penicillin-binding protein 3)
MTGTLPFLDEPPQRPAGRHAAQPGAFVPERQPRPAAGWRLGAISVGLAAAMVAIVGKLVVTAAPGTVPAANASAFAGEERPMRIAPSDEERADLPRAKIFDRNGALLAFSAPVHSLYAHPSEVPDPQGTAAALAKAFPDLNEDQIAKRLTGSEGDFVYVARHMTPAQYFKALQLGLPGVRAKREYRRVYPQGPLTTHVVGQTRSDQTALSGIEAFYDADLVGDPESPMHLSLDVRVQSIVREEVQAQIDAYAALGGVGVVMDVHTGEFLGSVSLPDFDPNLSGKRNPEAEQNRVTNGVYELGSVFKPVIASIALDANVAKLDTKVDATHPIYVHGYTIKDFHARNRWLSMEEVLVHSSNIGAARLATEIGVDRLVHYLGRFGLLSRPSLDLHEVSTPFVPKRWQELDAMTTAFGYTLAVSPAQFVATFGALVNGGTLYSPTFVRLNNPETAQGTQVLRQETSAKVRAMLRQVVVNGTGGNADTHLYPVGGKTGTALKRTEDGTNSRDKRISSFVGTFPINNPQYVVFVMIDEPQERKVTGRYATGGKAAAPAVSRIVDRIAPMLGVKPQSVIGDGDIREAKARGVITAAMTVRN